MKKYLYLLFLFFFIIPFKVDAIVDATSNFYVNDYANLLSVETKNYIMERSIHLEKNTKAQIVVVTVNDLEGLDIETYANVLFNSFEIGDSKENNGLLLLLAKDERKFRVEVGYGLEGVLPDGLTGSYQDRYIIPHLKKNDWNKEIKNGYTAFYEKLCDYYNIVPLGGEISYKDDYSYDEIYENNVVPLWDKIVVYSLVYMLIGGIIIGTTRRTQAESSKGKKFKFLPKNKILKILYILVILLNIFAIIVCYTFDIEVFKTGLFLEIIFYLYSRFYNNLGISGSGGHYSGHRSSSRGRGFSGGGGRSGGGGSSRGF